MAQKQSFDVTTVERKKKSCGFHKFCLLLTFSTIIILLILANINYIDETGMVSRNMAIIANTRVTSTAITAATIPNIDDIKGTALFAIEADGAYTGNMVEYSSETERMSVETSLLDELEPSSTSNCEISSDNCQLTCTGQNSDLTTILAKQYKLCGGAMNLILRKCDEKVNASFLKGDFRLRTLIFDTCVPLYFKNNAFDKSSLNALQVLKMLNTKIDQFSDTIFRGLNKLTHFEYVENAKATVLESTKFLTPMAETLQTVIIQQTRTPFTAYNIANWFQGTSAFEKMRYCDFANNSFTKTITKSTFANIRFVETLILNNCAIEHFDSDAFDYILKTLRYLDLSNNRLQTIEYDFLIKIENTNSMLTIALHNNTWDCSCEKRVLVDAIRNDGIQYTEEPICSSPEKYEDQKINEIPFCCSNEECDALQPTTTTTTTTTAATTTTTLIEEATTTMAPITATTPRLPTPQTPPPKSSEATMTTEETTSTAEAKTTATGEATTQETTSSAQPPMPSLPTPWSPSSTIASEVTTTSTADIGSRETTTSTPLEVSTAPGPSHEDLITLLCRNTFDDHQPAKIHVIPAQTVFEVFVINATSVQIEISALSCKSDLLLVYFMKSAWRDAIQRDINGNFEVTVNGLRRKHAYAFCMVSQYAQTVSPFDCISTFTMTDADENVAWLLSSDKPVYITIVFICILLFLFIGLLTIYLLLRWRPTLLKNSARLTRIDSVSQQMVLHKNVPEIFGEYASIYSETLKSDDYLEFCNNSMSALRSLSVDTQTTTESLAPMFRAPARPPPSTMDPTKLPGSPSALKSHINTKYCKRNTWKLDSLDELTEDDDNIYQSLEIYEKPE